MWSSGLDACGLVDWMHVVQLQSFLNKITIIQISYNAKNTSLAEWLSVHQCVHVMQSVNRHAVWLLNESHSKIKLVTNCLQAKLQSVPQRARSLDRSDKNGYDPGTSTDTKKKVQPLRLYVSPLLAQSAGELEFNFRYTQALSTSKRCPGSTTDPKHAGLFHWDKAEEACNWPPSLRSHGYARNTGSLTWTPSYAFSPFPPSLSLCWTCKAAAFWKLK